MFRRSTVHALTDRRGHRPRAGRSASGALKELGEELEDGTAAVIVLGESKIEEQLEQALVRANKLIEKQMTADAEALK